MSVFGVIPVRIQSESGKIRTRITPNTDTFHAVFSCFSFHIFKIFVRKRSQFDSLGFNRSDRLPRWGRKEGSIKCFSNLNRMEKRLHVVWEKLMSTEINRQVKRNRKLCNWHYYPLVTLFYLLNHEKYKIA